MAALTPEQAAFAAYWERSAGSPLKMPESWDTQPEGNRSDWKAAVRAAHPAVMRALDKAEDERDEARAECGRLRELLNEARIADVPFSDDPDGILRDAAQMDADFAGDDR